MIIITDHRKGITVQGHANYAAPGQDIVCAAISALFQSLIFSIEELTQDKIEYELNPGESHLKYRAYKDLSKESQLLIESFFIAVKNIVHSYPGHVAIEICTY